MLSYFWFKEELVTYSGSFEDSKVVLQGPPGKGRGEGDQIVLGLLTHHLQQKSFTFIYFTY